VSDLYPPTPRQSFGDAALAAVADMVPVLGPFVATVYQGAAKRQAAATGELIQQVAQDVGEELFSRAIEENPRLRSLMLNAIDHCYRTSFEQKRWRFAEALRDGILDPTKINDAIVELQVLRDVEVPHIQVLNELARIDLRLQALPPDELRVAHTEGLIEYQNAWNEFPAPITAVLVNAGLAKELPTIISTPPMQDPQPYTLVTPYGHKVLEDFRRLGAKAAETWNDAAADPHQWSC
jgi:hypothetical protein